VTVRIKSCIELPTVQEVTLDEDTIVTLADSVDQLRVVGLLGLSPALVGLRNGVHKRTLLLLNAVATDFTIQANHTDADVPDRIANAGTVTANCGALLWYDGDHQVWRVLCRS
jgi:hypothetical protein